MPELVCMLCGEPRRNHALNQHHAFTAPARVEPLERAARSRIRSTWTPVVCRACRRTIGAQRRPTGALALVQAHKPHCPARTAHAAV